MQLQTPVQKRKLSRRTKVSAALILVGVPAVLFVGSCYFDLKNYYLMALLVLLACMLPFFMVFEGRKPQARELVIIAVLCALGVAGRAAFFMLPQFKPVLALTIISGVAFGGETGFLVGAMTMLASNFLFSQGPWTPFQMFAAGIIGFLAGVLFRKGWLRRSRAALCVYGALAAILIYGGLMNPTSALIYGRELNWQVLLPCGLRPRRRHRVLSLGAGGAHAGKAGPHQNEIRPGRIKKRCGKRPHLFFMNALMPPEPDTSPAPWSRPPDKRCTPPASARPATAGTSGRRWWG